MDTVILSEIRKSRCDSNVARWLATVARGDLYISVAAVLEIERGIGLAQQRDPAFAQALDRWLNAIVGQYANRILTIDIGIARRWGVLSARVGHRGIDLAIAATALEHGLIVATRNVKDFLPVGVPVLNPFEPNPAVSRPPL
ncbi:MAG: type II toxin-antitoxin system VapC family toxin [Alphaproteobacteria bacterium]|nr:type II toxin-antitoxin system VapC family toxin [Alphaproteobacteria bacterium]